MAETLLEISQIYLAADGGYLPPAMALAAIGGVLDEFAREEAKPAPALGSAEPATLSSATGARP